MYFVVDRLDEYGFGGSLCHL